MYFRSSQFISFNKHSVGDYLGILLHSMRTTATPRPRPTWSRVREGVHSDLLNNYYVSTCHGGGTLSALIMPNGVSFSETVRLLMPDGSYRVVSHLTHIKSFINKDLVILLIPSFPPQPCVGTILFEVSDLLIKSIILTPVSYT